MKKIKLKDEKYSGYDIYVEKVSPQIYKVIVMDGKKLIYSDIDNAFNKEQLLKTLKNVLSWKKEDTNYKIVFRNNNQKILYEQELSGQISDGKWENSRPFNHWNIMTSAKIEVGSNVGTNFRPRRKYNFADKSLLEAVAYRMLFHVKAYNVLGFSPAFDVLSESELKEVYQTYSKYVREENMNKTKINNGSKLIVNNEEYHVYKVVDGIVYMVPYKLYQKFYYDVDKIPKQYHRKAKYENAVKVKKQHLYWSTKFIKIKNQLGVRTEEEYMKAINKIISYPYDMKDLKKDLKDMSDIVNNKRISRM